MRTVIATGVEGILGLFSLYLVANCIGLLMIICELPLRPFPLLFYPLKLIGAH